MAKKNNSAPPAENAAPNAETKQNDIFVGVDFGRPEQPTFIRPQRLVVGVNFYPEGAKEEKRVESGLIEAGTLPPLFEQVLRERKLLFDV